MTAGEGVTRTEAVMTGKVAAFVIRKAGTGDGHELLVFQHPMAGVQLPAGSLYDNEDAAGGCLRELYEETGLGGEDVRMLQEVGQWVESSSGLTRRLFQVRVPSRDSR